MKGKSRGALERYSGRKEFLVFGSPSIEKDEIDEVVSCMKSGWLGTGPRVALFERAFAAYKDVDISIAVSSCSAALHLSILVSGIGPGDEVITTPMTFCATVNAIIHAGATPVLADIDPQTMNIDPGRVEECITGRTKAILPVHFAGRPCEMDRLRSIANQYGLMIIEDCAHAVEAEFKGRKVGTIGDFGCFSFYATKNVSAGEGGMILVRRKRNAKKIRVLALHGLSDGAWERFAEKGFKHYSVIECGYKYNMMDIQAAVAIHQLARVDHNLSKRKAIWNKYQHTFFSWPIICPAEPRFYMRHAYHLYTLRIDERRCGFDRSMFIDKMTRRGIGVGVHYVSIPEHPYYQKRFGWRPEDSPNALTIGRQTVSLPLSPGLTDRDVDNVVESMGEIFGEYGHV